MNLAIIIAYIAVLIYASVTDYKKLIVKDRVHIILIVLALIGSQNFIKNTMGALILTLPFLILAVKTNQLGGGDIKFIFANGVFLGFWRSYLGILIGLIIIVIYYYFKNLRKTVKKRKIPLVPFLSLGYLFDLFLRGQ